MCVNQQWHPSLGTFWKMATLLTSQFSTQQLLPRRQLDINSKWNANSVLSVSHHLFLNIKSFPIHFLTCLFMETQLTLNTFYSTINLTELASVNQKFRFVSSECVLQVLINGSDRSSGFRYRQETRERNQSLMLFFYFLASIQWNWEARSIVLYFTNVQRWT
jgi:hypothetical protein